MNVPLFSGRVPGTAVLPDCPFSAGIRRDMPGPQGIEAGTGPEAVEPEISVSVPEDQNRAGGNEVDEHGAGDEAQPSNAGEERYSEWFSKHRTTGLNKILADKTFYEPKDPTKMWTSRVTYLMASAGGAVGIGNVWRFPFLCYRNGGATFLVPYFIFIFSLGIPLWILETSLGQGLGKSAIGCFQDLSPRLKGLGWICFVANAGITIYYAPVLAWSLRYLYESMGALGTSRLPWDGQSRRYFQSVVLNNAYGCWPQNSTVVQSEMAGGAMLLKDIIGDNINPTDPQLAPTDYVRFDEAVWAMERFGYACVETGFYFEGPLVAETVLALVLIWVASAIMLFLGTKTLKWSVYLTLPLPYVVLVIIFFRGITLKGAGEGIRYYLQPDWNRLVYDHVDPATGKVTGAIEVWISAASHVFFTFGLGESLLITLGSYNPPHFPVPSNALIIMLVNTGTEFFAGFCVFSILGFLADDKGKPIAEVVTAGPSLIFEALPEALCKMPSPAVFNVLLFVMVIFLGITSLTAMAEVSISIIRDQLQAFRARGSALASAVLARSWFIPVAVCLGQLLLGLVFCRRSGNLWVDLVDGGISKFLLTFIGLWEFIAVAWLFGLPQIRQVYHTRLGWFPGRYLGFIWRYYGPTVMILLLVFGFEDYIRNPVTDVSWAAAISWLMVVLPVLLWATLAVRAPDHDGNYASLRAVVDLAVEKWRGAGRGASQKESEGTEMRLQKHVSQAGLLSHASETGA